MTPDETRRPEELEATAAPDGALDPEPEESAEEVAARNIAKSPRRAMCAAVLALESIALGLTTPVMIMIAEVEQAIALTVGLGLAVACLVVAGMLRKEWAYHVGSVIQVAAIALGFVVPMMFVLGGIFAVLWFGSILLGRKIEREKREAWTQWLADEQAKRGDLPGAQA